MVKQPLPALWWLWQRVKRVEVVCPALICLYAQSVTAKRRFVDNACAMLEQERIICLPDDIWVSSVPAGEREVFGLEQRKQRSIHALLHDHLFRQRLTATHVSLALQVSIAHIQCYVKQIGQPPPARNSHPVHPWLPFDLPPPPSHEKMVTFITEHGRGTPETIRYLSGNNLRLLPRVAAKFNLINCVGLDYDDLVQNGFFGLLQASRYWDPAKSKGDFGAFAWVCVQGRMSDAVRAWRKKSGGRKRIRIDTGLLSKLFGCEWNPLDMLGKPGDPEFDDTLALALLVAEEELDEREKEVFKLRFPTDGSSPTSLRGAGKKLGISHEQVRLIEVKALNKISLRFAKSGLTTRHMFG